MKEKANTAFESSGPELLEKARNSQSTLLEEAPILGTPFKAVKEEKGGWFAAMGMNKLTEEHETVDELLKWMEENHWELLVRVITMVVQTLDLHKAKAMKEYMEKEQKENTSKPAAELVKNGKHINP